MKQRRKSREKVKQLQNNWNELKKFLIQLQKLKGINQQGFSWGGIMSEEEYISQISAEYTYMLDKQEEQLNKYKQALLDIKKYIETECSKEYCTNSRLYMTDGLKKDLIFKINKVLGSDSNECNS